MAERHSHLLTLVSQIVSAHLEHNVVATDRVSDLIHSVYKSLADLPAAAEGHAAGGHTIRGNSIGDHRDGHAHAHAHGHADAHPPWDQYPEPPPPPAATPPAGFVHPTYGQTVADDHLVCMEDGLRMKMLKRHLQKVHGMTPAQYRAKWGLPPDYPMVAAEYARLRSDLALESGLGLKPATKATRPPRS